MCKVVSLCEIEVEIQHLELKLVIQCYFLESYGKNLDVVKVKNLVTFVDIFGTRNVFEGIQRDLGS